MLNAFLNYVVPFGCGALASAIVSYFVWSKAIRDGVQCLLRAEILAQSEKWGDRGYCPTYAKEALTKAYKAYHALHGNDVATQKYKNTMALPDKRKDDEE